MTATAHTASNARDEWGAYWKLVLIAALGCILSSCANYILSVCLIPIEKEFGWSRAQISSGPMLVSITAVLLSTGAGYLIDRVGARRVGITVVLMMTASITLMGTMTNSRWQWWILWGVYGVASAATSTVWMAPLTTLFMKGRGLAIAFATMGTSLSSAIMPPLADFFVERGDWRIAFLSIGLFQAVVLFPLTLRYWKGAEDFIRLRAQTGPSSEAGPSGMVAERESAGGLQSTVTDWKDAAALKPGLTVREGFRSPAFYKIFAAYTIGLMGVAGVFINFVPVLVSRGIDSRQAALIAGSYGVASIGGRLLGGWAVDWVGPRWLTVWATLMILVMPIGLLMGGGSVTVAYAIAIAAAFFGGAKFPALIYLTSSYFGPKSFGTLFGTISIGGALAAGVGPWTVSSIYDLTGNYDLALWLTIPSLVVAAGLYATLGRPPDFAPARP